MRLVTCSSAVSACLQASDVYSLGVVLYELYCCQRAWAGMNDFQITYSVLWSGEELTLPEDTPAGYAKLVVSCLSREPEARPSAEQVVSSLEDLSDDLGVPTL